MDRIVSKRTLVDLSLFLLILGLAVLLSLALSTVNDDNNPFAMAVFILAVSLVARFTEGYAWGIAASVVGTFCVNYIFTYPFWSFDVTYPGYPLTMAVMLIVSILISTLTSRAKHQEQLRLEMEREKMHADLLRAVAHDIRTPLASILGAGSVLQEQELSKEDQRALIDSIHKDAEWLVRVTENLLSVTRFSGGDARLQKKDEVMEEIIGSAVLKYHRSPEALPVSVDAPQDILLVPMDATLIEQVLLNLFDNVSAHGKGASRIYLTVKREADRVSLTLEDDGAGIPSGLLPQILSGTLARARPDDRRSMGIGLSVCRSIVRAHGGEFTLGRSRSHGGACIQFYLPCAERET